MNSMIKEQKHKNQTIIVTQISNGCLLLFVFGFLCKDNYVKCDCDLKSEDDEDDVTQWVACRDPSHANTRPIYQSAGDTSNGASLKPNSPK